VIIFRKFVEKIEVLLKYAKNNATVLEGLCTFIIIFHRVLRMKNVSDKCRENKRNFIFSNCFPKNRAVCEVV